MNSEHAVQSRLSQIETHWTKLLLSQTTDTSEARQAKQYLMQRYSPSIFRYLVKATGNLDAAEELFQDFAVRFLRGDFKNATPERGQFRFFLKRSLSNLLIDFHRKKRKQPGELAEDVAAPADSADTFREADEEFTRSCRDDILQRTWAALETGEGDPFYTVLRLRTDHPDLASAQLAERVGQKLGRAVTPEWTRNRLHFAREKFTHLLLAEIEKTLATPTLDELEEEVLELGLLEYCRAALAKRRGEPPA